ncbi:MAG: hypothetical protein HYY66_07180 [Candidatus Tectomicrobia bacterium]|nr:hypothetical protein [Candidatus Tectomicrobia bacterium]
MDWIVPGIIFSLAAFAIYYPQLPFAVAVYRRFRRPRVLTCPATGGKVLVQLDAVRAARAAIFSGSPRLRVKGCARWWNGEQDCKRACLGQVL